MGRKGKGKNCFGPRDFLLRESVLSSLVLQSSKPLGPLSPVICLCSLARKGLKYSDSCKVFWTYLG